MTTNVIARTKDAIYVRLPREMQKPCDGCSCPYCKSHLDETPSWDTLAVPTATRKDRVMDHAWTVHMPDPKTFLEVVARTERATV